jgi:hypothetical protein
LIENRYELKYTIVSVGRNENARLNDIGETTVTDIINAWRRGTEDPNLDEYEAVRQLAIRCKKEGLALADFGQALRIKSYLERLGLDVRDKEESIENFIANMATQPEPIKLIEAAAQISKLKLKSDIPLERLDEHVKALKTENDVLEAQRGALLTEIEEKRRILDVDKTNVEDFIAVKEEMAKVGIEPTDSPRFLGVIRTFQRYGYDCGRLMNYFADGIQIKEAHEDLKRLKEELNNDRRAFDTILSTLGLGDLDQFKKIILELMKFENFGVGFDQIVSLSRSLDLNRLRREQWERRGRNWSASEFVNDNNGQGREQKKEYDYGYTNYPS